MTRRPCLPIRPLAAVTTIFIATTLGVQPAGVRAVDAAPALELERCLLRDDATNRAVSAKCGWLEVPENYEAPRDKTIKLKVAMIPALRKVAAPDAFTQIAGGPGGASTDDYVAWGFQAFAAIRQNRDIILVDQRGTGDSNPLDCPASLDDVSEMNDPEVFAQASEACLSGLRGDPRYYTTTVAVRDLDRVRAALGYERLNVYGVSYGTRVALQYLRSYPARVRTVVLDGVIAADQVLGPGIPVAAQQALDRIFERCHADDQCQRAFPDLKQNFRELRRRLQRQPESVVYRDPRSNEKKTVLVTDAHLAGVVRLMSYQAHTAALLPLTINQAYGGDHTGLAGQFAIVMEGIATRLANGLHNAVVCTEDVPFLAVDDQERARLEQTYLGYRMIEMLRAACRSWPKGVLAADFKRPVSSDKPVLLLSGEADPATPAANAERAHKTLPNARHVVVKGHGHGVARLQCVRQMISRFVNDASTDAVDDRCLSRLKPAPFFVNANGPAP